VWGSFSRKVPHARLSSHLPDKLQFKIIRIKYGEEEKALKKAFSSSPTIKYSINSQAQ